MQITKIYIQDYLGIGRFKTDKLGKMNIIKGGNGVGKSSILKAIRKGLKGAGFDPNEIKIDSDKAEILIELDNRIQVQRNITRAGERIEVKHDGQKLEKPQTWLNNLFGAYNFNPIDFFQTKIKERRQILLSAMPISLNPQMIESNLIELDKFDYSKHGLEVLKDIQAEVYDRRHEVNLKRTQIEKSINQDKAEMPENINKQQFEKFDLNYRIQEKAEAIRELNQYQNDKEQISILRHQGEEIVNEIESLNERISRLENNLKTLNEKGGELKNKISSFKEQETRQYIEDIQKDINDYQQYQKLALRLEDIARRESEFVKLDDLHKQLDDFYKQLTNEIPRKLLKQIKLPVENLRIEEDTIFIDGIDIDKMATSEQLKFSIQIAKALAGELKVICVDRFETLDENSRAIFEKEAAADEFEYFMTIVTNGDLTHEAINPDKPLKKSGQDKQMSVGF